MSSLIALGGIAFYGSLGALGGYGLAQTTSFFTQDVRKKFASLTLVEAGSKLCMVATAALGGLYGIGESMQSIRNPLEMPGSSKSLSFTDLFKEESGMQIMSYTALGTLALGISLIALGNFRKRF